ncbi:MAG: SGNH/GDSL hydrolase family protein [Chitinophagales bacterium]
MKYIRIALISITLLVLNYAVFIDIPKQFSGNQHIPELQRILLNRKIYLVVMLLMLLLTYVRYISKNPTIAAKWKPVFFSVISSVIIFYGVELYFTCKTKSHAIGYSYAGKLWMLKYWNPINGNGFRDDAKPQDSGKRTIFFIGDSFTAGHGIEDVSDRYSDLFKASRIDCNVYNLGINGIGTQKELDILKSAPVKPAIVFWQYFFNDIDELLLAYDYAFSFTPYRENNVWIRKITKGSFFFNYLYWSIPHEDASAYLRALEKGIRNKELIKQHLSDCDAVITYCKDNDIKLVLLSFPLFAVDDNHVFNKHTRFIADHFASKAVDVVRVDALTKDMRREEKMINDSDPHASRQVNRRVADFILSKMKI